MWAMVVFGLVLIWAFTLWKDKEPIIAGGISLIYTILVIGTFSMGIRYGTGVDDFCILNGHVTAAQYEEPWTEEYYTQEAIRDSKGNVTGYRTVRHETRHSPQWNVFTTVGNDGIEQAQYIGYVRNFQNEPCVSHSHPGQCSFGDGKTYVTRWDGDVRDIVPYSSSKEIVNWVKASYGTVYRAKGEDGYKVPDYPGLVMTPHGPKQPRILNPGVILDGSWKNLMEWDMDVLADAVGASKQCNPLIVITSSDIGYVQALKDKWINGKKNDVILVLGVGQDSSDNINWAQVVSWTKNETLEPFLKEKLVGTRIDDRAKIMSAFREGIFGHFERKRMAEFEYLKNEIKIPFWIYYVSLLYMIAGAVVVFFIPESESSSFPYRLSPTRTKESYPKRRF
jgi:hypothetical protein